MNKNDMQITNTGFNFLGKEYFNLDEMQEKQIQEREEQQIKLEEEKRIVRLETWYRSKEAGINPRFYNDSFDTYIAKTNEEKKNKEVCINFSKNPKDTLLMLCGKNGNGKSHLGSSIIRNFDGQGLYRVSALLCIEYESAGDYNAKKTRLEVIEYYTNADLLVIDEVGRYFNTQVEKNLLQLLISRRYDMCRPTVLISNMTKEAITDFVEKTIKDRFQQICIACSFNEESKRPGKRSI